MAEAHSTEPVGLDKHDPAGMANWLRNRAAAQREFCALTSDEQRKQFLERWQQNVLPHLAFRFEQAADMIERLDRKCAALAFLHYGSPPDVSGCPGCGWNNVNHAIDCPEPIRIPDPRRGDL